MQFKDSQRYQASPAKQIWDEYLALGATKAAVSMLSTTVLEDETFYHAYLDDYAQHYIYTDFAGQSFQDDLNKFTAEAMAKYEGKELTQELFNDIVHHFEESWGLITAQNCFDISYDLNDLFNTRLTEQCFIS